jgi:segregation and condensation protein B
MSENALPSQPLAVETEEGWLVAAGNTFMPLSAALETLLFVSDKAVNPLDMARTLGVQVEVVLDGINRLADELVARDRGLRVQFQGQNVRLITRPDAAQAIEEFLNLDLTTRLSGPALETLAVIAYRQPITRAQIEAVRGVDCGGVLRTLQQRGLVDEVGRLEAVGRPILYAITEEFMHHFGLLRLDDLPPLTEPETALIDSTLENGAP